MSIKVTHQREQKLGGPVSFYKPEHLDNPQLTENMVFVQQSKRLLREPLCLESPFKANEVFLPTEIDKLKKLFPLLDAKVSTHLCAKRDAIVIGRGAERLRPKVWQGLRQIDQGTNQEGA